MVELTDDERRLIHNLRVKKTRKFRKMAIFSNKKSR